MRIVAQFTGWPIAHAYRLASKGTMVSTRLWHLDVPSADEFVAESEKMVFALGDGLIGRVAEHKQPISCDEVSRVPTFRRAIVAQANGVRGYFAFPVLVDGQVEIILEFFSRDSAELRQDLLEMMSFVADRISRVIVERARNAHGKTLTDALNHISARLAETTADVEAGAAVVLTMAQDVDAHRSSVDETSTTAAAEIQDVAASTQVLVTLSHEAHDHAAQIGVIAGRTADTLNDAVTAFTDLETRIGSVGQISSLIGMIANQTNLLALNATIEAARAGDAGRGFAVVAGEVKALAHRVAEATDEIAIQIGLLQKASHQSTTSLTRVHGEIGAVRRMATDIQRVNAVQADASCKIADRVARARAMIESASGHLDSLRATIASALASSKDLSTTSGQLHAQGQELGKATRQLSAM